MCKKIFVILYALSLTFWIYNISFAMMCGSHAQHKQISQAGHAEHETASIETPKSEAINVGNKICPVSGEKIDEKMKATYEYEGKIYNFCCEMCIGEFKKDPEKYIKKVEEELRGQKEESAVQEGAHEGH